ncbi:MurR/RpiR family transcriptional regulator [Pandoraea sputorum]|uniref:MurR/RpiR family transcriptional regulator n=1 Tax=Pandoraea sputorum TaxID=93222 RepID=UPI001E4A044F|nr:MurR/RpiR family transcriptional regulator [Pandoraea sputorum]MCE4061242.1 MurR/RpiR family transcriptional regulator [Pandoraea sputorum]
MTQATALPQTLDQLNALLRERYSQLSPQFQAGARFLLDHPQRVPISSMRAIAAEAGVQPATFVRLAQHLGFDGWHGLRELFLESIRLGPQPYASRARQVIREGDAARMVPEMFRVQHNNLDLTEAGANDSLSAAVDLLANAGTVHVAGFRACFPIAFTFQYVYRLFRPTVHLIRGEAGTLEMELRALSARDVVVVISFAPYSNEALIVTRAARAAGARVLALTDSTVSPLALDADVTVLFSHESPSFFPSITAGIAVVETLVEMLLARKGRGAVRALELAEDQLHGTGAYVSPAGTGSNNASKPAPRVKLDEPDAPDA